MTTLTRDISASERQVPVMQGTVSLRPSIERRAVVYSSYTARSGLDVAVERAGERWVFRDLVTGVYGHGDTPLDAARDFRAALAEHRDVLERQEELSADLRFQLEYLRERV